ncbi:MAG TPA: efflux RND transporter periplasmic adaptor subunit [Blastocatellia bacterium]|nr:efflux RND transporter periplasmic adaptor subunit [Blastocatellia bacterium]
MAKKKSRKYLTAFIVIAAVAVAAVIYGLSVMSGTKASIDPSRLTAVERGDLARSVVATGRVEPISKVEIKSKANGIIKELKVNAGDMVSPGQVLAELDKENLAARLREARAALLSAQSNERAAQAEFEKNKVEAESPDVGFARRNVERVDKLFKGGLISNQELDDARRALEQAENRQQVARSQLSVTRARISQAEAEVAQSRAAVERAEEELNNATIRSPIHGKVLSRDVEVGSPVSSILNMGSAATLVMVLGDISQVYVLGKVDEADIGLVRLGQQARIKVETFKGKQFEGRVTQISPMGAEKDNVVSFEVRVSIDNPGGELSANMTANAEIILEERRATLIIPESAVIYDAQRNAWAETPAPSAPSGRERKSIKVGVSNGSRTEVVEGLSEGEQVILQ